MRRLELDRGMAGRNRGFNTVVGCSRWAYGICTTAKDILSCLVKINSLDQEQLKWLFYLTLIA